MQFNEKKCYATSIAHTKNPLPFGYTVTNLQLFPGVCQELPLPRVSVADNLSLSDHVHKVACKANRTFGFLRRNLSNSKPTTKEIAYMSFVCPQIEYASSVWDLYHQGKIHDLEMVQRHAARFLCTVRLKVGVVSSVLSKRNWSFGEERQKAARVVMLFKIVNKHVAVDSSHLLETPVHNTRSNSSTAQHSSIFQPPETATNTLSLQEQYPTGIISNYMFIQLALLTSSRNGYRTASQLFSTDTSSILGPLLLYIYILCSL